MRAAARADTLKSSSPPPHRPRAPSPPQTATPPPHPPRGWVQCAKRAQRVRRWSAASGGPPQPRRLIHHQTIDRPAADEDAPMQGGRGAGRGAPVPVGAKKKLKKTIHPRSDTQNRRNTAKGDANSDRARAKDRRKKRAGATHRKREKNERQRKRKEIAALKCVSHTAQRTWSYIASHAAKMTHTRNCP